MSSSRSWEDLFEDEVKPSLNRVQKLTGGFVDYLHTLSITSTVTATWRNLAETSPMDKMGVGYDAIVAAMTIAVKEGQDMARSFTTRQHPSNPITQSGDGSFWRGLGKQVAKKLAAATVPIGLNIGLAFGRQGLFQWAMANENTTVMLATMFAGSPFIHPLIAVSLTLGSYALAQRMIERIFPSTKLPEKDMGEEQDLMWFQPLLDGGLNILNAIALGEMLKLAINTLGPAIILHNSLAFMLPVVALLMVTIPLRHMSENLHPFKDMKMPFSGETMETEYDEEPSKLQQVDSVAANTGVSLGILAVATLTNFGIMRGVDPTTLSVGAQVAYSSALTGGAMFLKGLANNTSGITETVSNTASRASNYIRSFSIFGGHRQDGYEEVENGNERRLSYSGR